MIILLLQTTAAAEDSKHSQEVSGVMVGGERSGSAGSKWEALSLVPDRSVDGLVTRKWDRRMARKPKMVLKKCEIHSIFTVTYLILSSFQLLFLM